MFLEFPNEPGWDYAFAAECANQSWVNLVVVVGQSFQFAHLDEKLNPTISQPHSFVEHHK
ncbi:MAG: hypothetical protein EBT69_09675 [Verrucomicrobia bacterium]|nr:hypothetical protein [Verrucomicrobiota bacterium]